MPWELGHFTEERLRLSQHTEPHAAHLSSLSLAQQSPMKGAIWSKNPWLEGREGTLPSPAMSSSGFLSLTGGLVL